MGCTQAKCFKASQKIDQVNNQKIDTHAQITKLVNKDYLTPQQYPQKFQQGRIQKDLQSTRHHISFKSIQVHTLKQLYGKQQSSLKKAAQKSDYQNMMKSANQKIMIQSLPGIEGNLRQNLSLHEIIVSKKDISHFEQYQEQNEINQDQIEIHFFDQWQFQVPQIPKIKEFQYKGTMCAVYNC